MSIDTIYEFYMKTLMNGRRVREVVHKFGHNEDVGTTYEPVCAGGIYMTPQVSGASKLRIKAGNANDTAAGSGAREVTLEFLDVTGTKVTETLATAGISASATTSVAAIRLFRSWVSASGTYATASAGSHAANIVIEDAAGANDWGIIEVDGFPTSQTEIGAYTVPLGFEALVHSMHINVDSNKVADVLFFQRQNILETAAPYTAMRLNIDFFGVTGSDFLHPTFPIGPFPELTDLGFMAKATTTANVEVDFEIALISKAD